ncbi:hypothetical protein [Rubripirellula amarantea]|uniref:hypothetical protein n=1 Tax=Rubripirellula amarantea TaxID=2527999 RepID=UPI0011B80C20|nr:hypothetical protein [Rubripirellula amarantea]
MTFKDAFPLEIEFDVDRKRLLDYLLAQARIGCFGSALPFCLLFSLPFFKAHMLPYQNAGALLWLGWLTVYLIAGCVVCALFGSILYFSYFRPSARLQAANLRVMVDGPYLRLVTGGFILLDQRFHFRDVSSYGTIQGPLLRRHGLKSLTFRMQGRPSTPPLSVAGLVDPDRVRDVLCEIDASRELTISFPDDATETGSDG